MLTDLRLGATEIIPADSVGRRSEAASLARYTIVITGSLVSRRSRSINIHTSKYAEDLSPAHHGAGVAVTDGQMGNK